MNYNEELNEQFWKKLSKLPLQHEVLFKKILDLAFIEIESHSDNKDYRAGAFHALNCARAYFVSNELRRNRKC